MHHIGDVQLVGKEDTLDGLKVEVDGAVAALDGEMETLGGSLDDGVKVNFSRGEGVSLARHFGALEEGLDEDAHAPVLFADDVDEIAP